MTHLDADGDLNVIVLLRRLFESRGSKARILSQAYHRYALNYINALNYLETLRRQNDFCDFEKVKRKKEHLFTVFENHRKSSIQHCERSELRLHFEWTKVDSKCSFWRVFEKLNLAVK